MASIADQAPVTLYAYRIPMTMSFNRALGTLASAITANDFNVTNATVTNLVLSNGIYSFDIVPPAQSSLITVSFPAGRVADTDENPNLVSDAISFQYDNKINVINISTSATNGVYRAGSIPVNIEFNKPVVVTGTPTLSLNTIPANDIGYLSGSGAKILTFLYLIGPLDSTPHLDAAGAAALNLNGGSIKDSYGNDAITLLPDPGALNSLGAQSLIAIDTTAPDTPSNLYLMSPAVSPNNVANPVIGLTNLESGAQLSLFSDANCSVLVASMTVNPGDQSVTLPAILTGDGTYSYYASQTDPAGNTSACSTSSVTYIYDGTAPTVLDISTTDVDSIYGGGFLTLNVNFSEPIWLSGTPTLQLNTTPERFATYVIGSGTSQLQFRYEISPGDFSSHLDVASVNSLNLNGGTLKDEGLNDAVLTLPTPGQLGSLSASHGLIIDTTVVGQVTGLALVNPIKSPSNVATPTVAVSGAQVGDTIAVFSDDACSILLGTAIATSYTQQVLLSPLSAGSYTLHANTTTAEGDTSPCSVITLTYVYDTVSPVIIGVDAVQASGTYTSNALLQIKMTLSAPVIVTGTPTLTLNTTPSRVATYVSGSGSSTLNFNYTVSTGDNSTLLDYASTTSLSLNGGSALSLANNSLNTTLINPGLTGSLSQAKTISIDTTPPTTPGTPTLVSPLASPGNISTPTVRVSGLAIGDTVKVYTNAACTTEIGTTVVTSTTQDLSVALTNNGTYQMYAAAFDPFGNKSGCSASSLAYVYDSTSPRVLTITSTTADGAYSSGKIILQVQFSEIVTVSGVPLLSLNASTSPARYVSGSGSNTLTFHYLIGIGDTSSLLDYKTSSSLTLGLGSSIMDQATNPAILTLPNPGGAGSLGANKSIQINGGSIPVPAALLSGLPTDPSNATSLNVTVGGTDVVAYRYKVGSLLTTDCSSATGYAVEALIATRITSVLGADGAQILCVVGRDSLNVYQPFTAATVFQWSKDVAGSIPVLTNKPAAISNLTKLNIFVTGIDLVGYRYKVGVSASTNCATSTNYSATTISSSIAITNSISGLADGTLRICVVGVDSLGNILPYTSATSYSWTKDTVAPTPTLSGTPSTSSNVGALNVTVGGTGVIAYLYKFGLSSNTNCTLDTAYSAVTPTTVHITSSLSAYADSPLTLCVRGIDAAGNTTALASAVSFNWTKDTIPSLAVLSGTPATISNATALNVTVGGTDIASYRFKVGAMTATDCSVNSGYSLSDTPIATLITNSLTAIPDGDVRLCVIGVDSAGNRQDFTSATSYT